MFLLATFQETSYNNLILENFDIVSYILFDL